MTRPSPREHRGRAIPLTRPGCRSADFQSRTCRGESGARVACPARLAPPRVAQLVADGRWSANVARLSESNANADGSNGGRSFRHPGHRSEHPCAPHCWDGWVPGSGSRGKVPAPGRAEPWPRVSEPLLHLAPGTVRERPRDRADAPPPKWVKLGLRDTRGCLEVGKESENMAPQHAGSRRGSGEAESHRLSSRSGCSWGRDHAGRDRALPSARCSATSADGVGAPGPSAALRARTGRSLCSLRNRGASHSACETPGLALCQRGAGVVGTAASGAGTSQPPTQPPLLTPGLHGRPHPPQVLALRRCVPQCPRWESCPPQEAPRPHHAPPLLLPD